MNIGSQPDEIQSSGFSNSGKSVFFPTFVGETRGGSARSTPNKFKLQPLTVIKQQFDCMIRTSSELFIGGDTTKFCERQGADIFLHKSKLFSNMYLVIILVVIFFLIYQTI